MHLFDADAGATHLKNMFSVVIVTNNCYIIIFYFRMMMGIYEYVQVLVRNFNMNIHPWCPFPLPSPLSTILLCCYLIVGSKCSHSHYLTVSLIHLNYYTLLARPNIPHRQQRKI
jgi:hypothetical protein